jgi:DNA-binding NarL/FixJ family response regulator
MKRLIIVADNSFAAQSIRLILRQTVGFQVVGFVDAAAPVTQRIAELQPDVVLIDDTQDPQHPVVRLKELATHVPDAMRIFLTLRMDNETVTEILDAGADAILSKTIHLVSLATLLRELVNGTIVQRPHPQAKAALSDCPLTEREQEILRLVAQGYTNAQIARKAWVTEQTIKFHLSNTYRKLGVANRTEASRYAHMSGLMAA